MCGQAHLQKPETRVRCFPQSLSILLFETESAVEPRAYLLARLAGQQALILSNFESIRAHIMPTFAVLAKGDWHVH